MNISEGMHEELATMIPKPVWTREAIHCDACVDMCFVESVYHQIGCD